MMETDPHGDKFLKEHDPGHEIDEAVVGGEQGCTVGCAQLEQRPEVGVQGQGHHEAEEQCLPEKSNPRELIVSSVDVDTFPVDAGF